MLPIILILLSFIAASKTCSGAQVKRKVQFGSSVVSNGYCGTSKSEATSRCILCRDESECSEDEKCILLEYCEEISPEKNKYENEIQQTGYCAPDFINAAKCLYQDYPCTSDKDCKVSGNSCYFSINWCVPGEFHRTYFCAKDLESATECNLSKLCQTENDICTAPGETCIETDYCNVSIQNEENLAELTEQPSVTAATSIPDSLTTETNDLEKTDFPTFTPTSIPLSKISESEENSSFDKRVWDIFIAFVLTFTSFVMLSLIY